MILVRVARLRLKTQTRLGSETTFIEDACKGVNRHEEDIDSAFDEMNKVGVNIVRSKDLI